MEETTGNRVTPYEDFADLFPASSDEPERPAAQPRPEDAGPAVANHGNIRPGADGPARDGQRKQDILSTARKVLSAVTPALALLGLAAGGGALWLSYKQPAELDALHTSLARLQADVSHGFEIKREVAALTSALQATQAHIAALDDAVAQQITSASQAPQLRDLAARLDTLTAAVEELHARASEPKPAVSAKTAAATSTRPRVAPTAATWAIRLGAFSKQNLADAEVARLQALDIPAEKRSFKDAQGKTWHRVFVPGFETRKAAENAKAAIQAKAGLSRTWLEQVPAQKTP